MYNVRVCFAHGVEFKFANVDKHSKDYFDSWINNDVRYYKTPPYPRMHNFKHEDKTYILNRDYVCAVVIEEVI